MKKLFALFCLTARLAGGQVLVGVELDLAGQGYTFGTNYMVEGGWLKRMQLGTNTMTADLPLTNGPGTYKVFSRIYSPNASYTNTITFGDGSVDTIQSALNWVARTNTTTVGFTNVQILMRKGILTNVHDNVIGGIYIEPVLTYANAFGAAVVNTTHFFADFGFASATNTSDIVTGNLIPNSSFELGFAGGWGFPRDTYNTNSVTWQEEVIDPTEFVTGTKSVRVSDNYARYQLISPPLRHRGTNVYRPYTLTLSAKRVGSSTPTLTFNVQTTTQGILGVYTNRQQVTIGVPTTNWTRYTNTFYFQPVPTREFYLTMEHLVTGGDGVVIDDIMLEEGTNARPWQPRTPVEVAIKTGRNGNLFLAGDPVQLQLVAYNSHATNRVITVATEVYYYDNSLASNMITTVSVPPGGSTNIIHPPSAVGPYRVSNRIIYEPSFYATETSYSVAAFGPNDTTSLPNSNAWIGTHAPSTKASVLSNRIWGVDISRAFSAANMFRQTTIQPSSNTWVWNPSDVAISNTAPTLAIYGAFGDIKGSPSWAYTNGIPIPSVIESFASNVVARYKDRVGWWELMNEPYTSGNWNSTNAWEKTTTALIAGIRAADPNARISAGVMDSTNDWISLYAALSPTTRTQINDAAFHYYPSYVGTVGKNMNGNESFPAIKVTADLVRGWGYRPINSESGMWDLGVRHFSPNWYTQGKYLWTHLQDEAYVRGHVFTTFEIMRHILRCVGNGMVFFHYYAALAGFSPTRPDTQPTLFENDDSLKAQGLAFYTACNFVGKGTPLGPITNTAAGSNIESYAYQGNNGEAVVCAWTLSPGTNRTVTITNTAFEVRNVFGRLIQSNSAVVTVGMLPVYIRSTTLATNTLIAEYVKGATAGAGTLPAPEVSIDYSPEGAQAVAPFWFKWSAVSKSAINYFTQPQLVMTRYRVYGTGEDWSEWDNVSQLVRETLPAAGIYRLEVQTKHDVGSTNSAVGPWFFVNDGPNWRIGTLSTP